MIANVPAVLLGEQLAERLPVRLVHLVAAAIFAVLASPRCWERKSSSPCNRGGQRP